MARFGVTLDEQLYKEAGELLYSKYTLKLPAATRLFLAQTVSLGKLPFNFVQQDGLNLIGIEESLVSQNGIYFVSDWSVITLLAKNRSGVVAQLNVSDSESISQKSGLSTTRPVVYNLALKLIGSTSDPNAYFYIYAEAISSILNNISDSESNELKNSTVELNIILPRKGIGIDTSDLSHILPRTYKFIDGSVAYFHLIDLDLIEYFKNFYSVLAEQFLTKFKDNFYSETN